MNPSSESKSTWMLCITFIGEETSILSRLLDRFRNREIPTKYFHIKTLSNKQKNLLDARTNGNDPFFPTELFDLVCLTGVRSSFFGAKVGEEDERETLEEGDECGDGGAKKLPTPVKEFT